MTDKEVGLITSESMPEGGPGEGWAGLDENAGAT